MNHKFCKAKVFHARNFPKKNSFLYNVYYLLLDIDYLETKTKFFSFNKFNLFSFYKKDYLKISDQNNWPLSLRDTATRPTLVGNPTRMSMGHAGNNLRNAIEDILNKENIKPHKVLLMTHPRLFGYAFNPVSFYFCLNEKDQLISVLAEVNNTFGETHYYLIYNQDHSLIDGAQDHFAKKEFHVSPFFKREGRYRFKFEYNPQKIKVFIDYFSDNKLMLQTSLIADVKPLSDWRLIKAFFTIPLLTLKVIILIHYQALKIILKGIKYITKPAQLSNKITKNE